MNQSPWPLINFLLFSSLFLGAVAGFNLTISPLENQGPIPKHFKPLVNERADKYETILKGKKALKHDLFFIGSSSSMQLKATSETHWQSYNIAVSNIMVQEVLFLVGELIKKGPPKTIIYGFDFANLNLHYDPLSTNAKALFQTPRTLSPLSWETIKLSYQSLKNYRNNKKQNYFESSGILTYVHKNERIQNDKNYFSDEEFIRTANTQYNFLYRPKKTTFKFNERVFDYLTKLKSMCEKAGVKLIVFVPPMNKHLIERMKEDQNLWAHFSNREQHLTNVFDQYWDFAFNHPINNSNSFFYDAAHPNRLLASVIVKKMLGKQVEDQFKDYGKRISRVDL